MSILETIKSASETAQRCQRNWDLSKDIPQGYLDIFLTTIKNAPAKQNEDYYSVYFITDRNIIEQVYNNTTFNTVTDATNDLSKNPQVLANLLIAFCEKSPTTFRNNINEYQDTELMKSNRNQAIGIVSGQLALVANMLGLRTGFCGCVDPTSVAAVLKSPPVLLTLGIGYPDTSKHRLQHQRKDVLFKSFNKPIEITTITSGGELRTIESDESTEVSYPATITYQSPSYVDMSDENWSWIKNYGLTESDVEALHVGIHSIFIDSVITSGVTNYFDAENFTLKSTWTTSSEQIAISSKARMMEISKMKEFHSTLRGLGWIIT